MTEQYKHTVPLEKSILASLHCQIEAMANDALLATAREARNARFRLFDRFAAIEKELREVHRGA